MGMSMMVVNSLSVFTKTLCVFALLILTSCQFQPLYTSPSGTTPASNLALSNISVSDVSTREAQQVRNHLIFLLSGGSSPIEPSHDIRLRVSSSTQTIAGTRASVSSSQLGNTAGTVAITVSYDLYELSQNKIVTSGSRTASAAFDKTSQSFSSERAERDAVNRAAKAAAEQVRLAISSDLNQG